MKQDILQTVRNKFSEIDTRIKHLKSMRDDLARQVQAFQKKIDDLDRHIHEQSLMQSPLLELLQVINDDTPNQLIIPNTDNLYEKIYTYFKKKWRSRKSEIADMFGNNDRKSEMHTYQLVNRLEWDWKIRAIPELLPNWKQRERDLLYEIIS